jgi:hypothetical protein
MPPLYKFNLYWNIVLLLVLTSKFRQIFSDNRSPHCLELEKENYLWCLILFQEMHVISSCNVLELIQMTVPLRLNS